MNDAPLLIWVNSPPFVEKGAFGYLEETWPGGVVYIVLGQLRSERTAMGWDSQRSAGSARHRARGEQALVAFCQSVLAEFPHSMHLVAGLSSTTGRALSQVTKAVPRERVAVFSERPAVYGPAFKRHLKRLALPIKYRWLVRRFRKRVGLLLPLGLAGIRDFAGYGWPRQTMAPFMYCPAPRAADSLPVRSSDDVRFLYIGRLSRYTKGTDVLLAATKALAGAWTLTIVGGHGDLVNHVKRRAAVDTRISAIGALDPARRDFEISQHDVCIVPSRVDGWNVVVNEAIYAGRGVICTDTAGSDELVSASGAGVVIEGGSRKSLAASMQMVIDNRALAAEWSALADAYRPLIEPRQVGQYLLELLRDLEMSSSEPLRPPPWLPRAAEGAS